jgi:hypothetical protein
MKSSTIVLVCGVALFHATAIANADVEKSQKNLNELVVKMYDLRANQRLGQLAELQRKIEKFEKERIVPLREKLKRLKQLELDGKFKKSDGSPKSIQELQEVLQELP